MDKKTKYPWHLAPEWAQWAATNVNGTRIWFKFEPKFVWVFWIDNTGCKEEIIDRGARISAEQSGNSLKKRPDNA